MEESPTVTLYRSIHPYENETYQNPSLSHRKTNRLLDTQLQRVQLQRRRRSFFLLFFNTRSYWKWTLFLVSDLTFLWLRILVLFPYHDQSLSSTIVYLTNKDTDHSSLHDMTGTDINQVSTSHPFQNSSTQELSRDEDPLNSKKRNIQVKYVISSSSSSSSFSLPSTRDITPTRYSHCAPLKAWQETSFPTCNTVHEMDMSIPHTYLTRTHELVHHGTIRDVWKVSNMGMSRTTTTATKDMDQDYEEEEGMNMDITWKSPSSYVALKTLRWQKDFSSDNFNGQRFDSMVSERLTSSPFVADIYGYCM